MRKILIFVLVLIPFVVNRATPDDYDWDLDGVNGRRLVDELAALFKDVSTVTAR